MTHSRTNHRFNVRHLLAFAVLLPGVVFADTAAERKEIAALFAGELRRQTQLLAGTEQRSAVARRLTNFEYENTMRDLLSVDLRFKESLPEDPVKPYHFNNTAEFMLVGPEQIERYLECAKRARASVIVNPAMPEVRRERREWKPEGAYRGMGLDEVGIWGNRRGSAAQGIAIENPPRAGEFRIRFKASAILPAGVREVPRRLVMGYNLDVNNSTLRVEPVGAVRLKNSPDAPEIFELRGRIENFPVQPEIPAKGKRLPERLHITPQVLFDDGTLNDQNGFHKLRREATPRAVVEWMEFEGPLPLGERAGTEEPYRPTVRDYMLDETIAFVGELIRCDASVLNVVDSDFAMLNQRLAAHYGVAGVPGDELRAVPLKTYVTYLRGLDHKGALKMGGHSGGDVFATGADMTETQRTNDISVDQVAANALGHHTHFASLVLGTEGGTGSYGMSKTLSHRGPGRPIPSMHRPQDIFNRRFNPSAGKGVEEVRAGRKGEASILDLLLENSRSLKGRLGSEDAAKMDECLDSIRSLEQRVERTSKWTQEPLPKLDTKGLNLEVAYNQPLEYIRCMYDLVFLAFQTDSTPFASLMLESENSQSSEMWNYANYSLGYKGATHDIARKRPEDFSGRWDHWRAQQHAYFLQRLSDTPEGEGTMLDRTLVLWGSAHPLASHNNQNYPLHLAGGNHLGFKHGRLHAFEGAQKVPLANLCVSMLNAVDVPTEKFADSTGAMTQLTS